LRNRRLEPNSWLVGKPDRFAPVLGFSVRALKALAGKDYRNPHFFAGVEGAEAEMGGGMWGAALATVGEGEGTEIGAVLCGD
jgi:hypothetical protein